MTDLPIVAFRSAHEWRVWLKGRHASSPGVWLKIAKMGLGLKSVTYDQALDVALCFGWIDGQKAGFDERYWLQRFSPRRSRSKWSRVNRERAVRLTERGEMHAAGLREVARAKADGRWEAAYAGQGTATVPEDLQRALEENPKAQAFFLALDRLNRYAILYRIGDAKRPETRAKRIERFVQMLARNERIYG